MNIPFSPPDLGDREIAAVAEVIRSGWITTGPRTKELEKRVAAFCKTPRAACLCSATAAMEMTLRLFGIGPGDEVITSAYTYSASASVICHVGARPVLVDTAPGRYTMDPVALEAAVTTRTKAVIPVDLAGIICDYSGIRQMLQSKQGLFRASSPMQEQLGRVLILADAAHSFGSTRDGHHSGQLADFSCFSFHAVKNLTTAEGGAVTWQPLGGMEDDELYRLFMLYSLHGQTKDALSKAQVGAWEYDILFPAYKCNMTDIMASIGLVQLERYESFLARRRQIKHIYNDMLSSGPYDILQHEGMNFASNCHLYMLRLLHLDEGGRNKVIEALDAAGVSSNVHFKPLPMFSAYKNLGFSIDNYPNAYTQYANELTLPLHTLLSDEQAEYVASALHKAVHRT